MQIIFSHPLCIFFVHISAKAAASSVASTASNSVGTSPWIGGQHTSGSFPGGSGEGGSGGFQSF